MNINVLKASEWSEEYERLRRNRMVIGAFRYGPIQTQDMDAYDYVKECRRRLRVYEEDLNLEHLVDCGNILMLEYIKGQRTGLTLTAVDDGQHNEKRK
jgi:hypothetical protein